MFVCLYIFIHKLQNCVYHVKKKKDKKKKSVSDSIHYQWYQYILAQKSWAPGSDGE